MLGIMIESILMAFTLGGILGAVTALHLRSEAKQQPAKAKHLIHGNQLRRF
jgi:hypothetical protein